MAEVTTSLKQLIQKRVWLLLTVLFIAIVVTVLFFVNTLNQSSVEKELQLKHKSIEQLFNSHLIHAEGEMSLLNQGLSSSHYESGRELDLLFKNHDMLFFGRLDFFYIEWNNADGAIDPRARLFTKVDFQPVLKKGLINRWVIVYTQDDSILLMHKKKIISDHQKNIGFLYGFISLNDNLSLLNELLNTAQVNSIRIYDRDNQAVLLEGKSDFAFSASELKLSLPFSSPIKADLALTISQKNTFSFVTYQTVFPFLFILMSALFAFYLLLMRQVKSLVFSPLEMISYRYDEKFLPFKELQLIQSKNHHNVSLIEARDYRFKLLTESIHCAIIFCNEVAEVDMLNTEAKVLFPDAERARTVFDFMPISCHQAIQEALRGEIGISFDLTMNNRGRLYTWQAYTFSNENHYQGVLLVGQDTTKETSLIWQLEQLQPIALSAQKHVDTDVVFNELSYLSKLPHRITSGQLQGWIKLLVSVLDSIRYGENEVVYLPIGDVLSQESTQVMRTMGVEANRARLDCPLDVSIKVIAVNGSFKSLIRLAFMMVMSNEMAERSLTIRFDNNTLELIVIHDMTSRPLFMWMVEMLLVHFGGDKKVLRNNALQLNLTIKEKTPSYFFEPLSPDTVVAWVVNDYPNQAIIKQALTRLGIEVKEYISADSFFTQSSEVNKFDAVLIGCDKDINAQLEMTKSLKLKYSRNELPIVWLNSTFPKDVDSDVSALLGCPFEYSLHQVLLEAFKSGSIVPMLANKQKCPWVMVGGSRVSKAIWYTELEKHDVSVYWLEALDNYDAVLSLYHNASIVLLEPQSDTSLRSTHETFPKAQFYSVQSWLHMPDNVTLIEMERPYSGNQIKIFLQNAMQHVNNERR